MDIEKYNPKRDPKYSGYVYRFLKKEAKLAAAMGNPPRIIKFRNGFGWYIGWFTENDERGFTGSSIRPDCERVQVYCYVKTCAKDITQEVPWAEYGRVGRCAFDNYGHKWVYANKNSRKCLYCGKWQRGRMHTQKTVQRWKVWETV